MLLRISSPATYENRPPVLLFNYLPWLLMLSLTGCHSGSSYKA